MAKRPEGDLGSMAISKTKAAETVPFGAATPAAPAPVAPMGKSLTVKLDGDLYLQLADYCSDHLRRTGKKLFHQEVMVEGLKMLLAARRQ
jgi:hypothetical protein